MKNSILFIGLLFILSACTSTLQGDVKINATDIQNIRAEDLDKLCNSPYIRIGLDCCLDQNDNKICDRDEIEDNDDTAPMLDSSDAGKPQEALSPQKPEPTTESSPQTPSGELTNFPEKVIDLDLVSNDQVLGDISTASTVIVEFGDFGCPFCEKFFDKTFPSIKEDIEDGEVAFIFVDFPLDFHVGAKQAAVAANCAARQNAYWEMHERLFDNQDAWIGKSNVNTIFISYADYFGLSTDTFATCLEDEDMLQEVEDDIKLGMKWGVSGVPTFFLNDKVIAGAVSYQSFLNAYAE